MNDLPQARNPDRDKHLWEEKNKQELQNSA